MVFALKYTGLPRKVVEEEETEKLIEHVTQEEWERKWFLEPLEFSMVQCSVQSAYKMFENSIKIWKKKNYFLVLLCSIWYISYQKCYKSIINVQFSALENM